MGCPPLVACVRAASRLVRPSGMLWHSERTETGSEGGDMEGIAKLISASAWALVALMLAAGIPFAWRRVLAWIDAKSQVAMAEAVRRMIEE